MILRPLFTVLMGVLIVGVLAACEGDDRPAEAMTDANTLRGDTVAVADSLVEGPDEGATANGADGADGADGANGADGVNGVDGAPPQGTSEGEAADDELIDPPGSADRPATDAGSEGDRSDAPDVGPDDAVGGEPVAPEAALAATYQLASVEGESLPVTIGEGPECDLQLVNGDLRIEDNRDFVLRTTVHHVCGGERAGEELHTAEGSVADVESGLRFDAHYESLFATAHGRRLADGTILINRLETAGESHDVEWRFLR